MGFFNSKTHGKQIRTTILIDDADFDYIRQKRLKATSLLRIKIKELRDREKGDYVDFVKANNALRDRLNKMCDNMAKANLTEDQFNKILE